MFNISDYLEKFKNLGNDEKELKERVVFVIKEVVGIEIKTQNIKIKNGELSLSVSPGVKNAIFIKKELILKKIKEGSKKIVNDVR